MLQLIVQPIADCHDWLHNQLQIAMTGYMTNCRLPQLVAWPTADCHDSLRVHSLCWGLHSLCWHVLFRRSQVVIYICTFSCFPAATSSASGCDLFALPLPFLSGISSALFCQEVERILILMLDWAPFYMRGKTGCMTSHKVAQLVVTGHNRSHYQSWCRTTSHMTNCVTRLAKTNCRSPWLVARLVVQYKTRLQPPAIWNCQARVLNITVDLAATNLPLAITHNLYDQMYSLSLIPPWFPPLSVVPSS